MNHYLKLYIRLMRPKHYLKNLLIFLPAIFSGTLFNDNNLLVLVFSFLAISAVASAVYVVNDIRDRKLDASHPSKKNRPIASGLVGPKPAAVFVLLLLCIAVAFQYFAGFSTTTAAILFAYLIINILYSFGLKNVPIIDVAILSFGFVLRVLYGGESIDVDVSSWLYLATLAFSFYLSLGKRRNEIRTVGTKTRKVNKFYNKDFLDKNMYVSLGLAIVYYSLWATDPSNTHKNLIWTVPIVIIIVMAYSLAVEDPDSGGDPVDVVLSSKLLLLLVTSYGLILLSLVYL